MNSKQGKEESQHSMELTGKENKSGGINRLGISVGLRLVNFSHRSCPFIPLFMPLFEKTSEFLGPRSFPP